MYRRIIASATAVFAMLAMLSLASAPASAGTTHLSRIFYIMMENQGFDDVIGHEDAATSSTRRLSPRSPLRTGSTRFRRNDAPQPSELSFARRGQLFRHPGRQRKLLRRSEAVAVRHARSGDESRGSARGEEDDVGRLRAVDAQRRLPRPAVAHEPDDRALRAETQPVRILQGYRDEPGAPEEHSAAQQHDHAGSALANPKTAPNFVFIVPDECHDMHGTKIAPPAISCSPKAISTSNSSSRRL